MRRLPTRSQHWRKVLSGLSGRGGQQRFQGGQRCQDRRWLRGSCRRAGPLPAQHQAQQERQQAAAPPAAHLCSACPAVANANTHAPQWKLQCLLT